jgi:hydroxymethylpyrimidine/phosphomethylpyrimidine kinase
MISTSGSELLPSSAVSHLSTHLLPLTTVLTPNIPEANLILRQNSLPEVDIRTAADLETIARRIRTLGPKWVLIKGGHVPFKEDLSVAGEDDAEKKVVVDVLAGEDGEDAVWIQSAWQSSTSTHGTGCSLACKLPPDLIG